MCCLSFCACVSSAFHIHYLFTFRFLFLLFFCHFSFSFSLALASASIFMDFLLHEQNIDVTQVQTIDILTKNIHNSHTQIFIVNMPETPKTTFSLRYNSTILSFCIVQNQNNCLQSSPLNKNQ